MQLQDRTGVISGMRWNADEKLAERFVKGSYVQVQGASQLHNGILQLIVNQIALVDEKTLDVADFDTGTRVDVEQLWAKLGEVLSIATQPSQGYFVWRPPGSRHTMRIRVDCSSTSSRSCSWRTESRDTTLFWIET
jgi:hypothetical protein